MEPRTLLAISFDNKILSTWRYAEEFGDLLKNYKMSERILENMMFTLLPLIVREGDWLAG